MIAFAAPSWSDASAASTRRQPSDISLDDDQLPTQYYVCFGGLFLQDLRIVQATENDANGRVSLFHSVGFVLRAYQSCIFVVRMCFVKCIEGVSCDVASHSSAEDCQSSILMWESSSTHTKSLTAMLRVVNCLYHSKAYV